jgi:hypothetical protein
MTETELVEDLCNAMHRAARYSSPERIEKVRALLNCYVVTAVGAAVAAYFEKANEKLLEKLKAHVDNKESTHPIVTP